MDISTEKGKILAPYPMTVSKFLNQTTICYGASRSGKSTMCVDILHSLKDHVSMCYVISPTELANGTYKGKIPQAAIRYQTDKNSVLEFMRKLWERQEMITSVYKKANDPLILSRLYKKVCTSEKDSKLKKINQFEKDALEKVNKYIEQSDDENNAVRKEFFIREKDRIQDDVNRFRLAFYRSVILPHRKLLSDDPKLSEDEKYSLKYLKTNPNVALIIDDAAARIKPIQKMEIFNNYVFMNRHVNITTLIAAHDDTHIEADIRKNAFQSIFCTPQVALAYFTRKSNDFSKEEIKEIPSIIQAIYTGVAGDYKKLIYSRGAPEPYGYITAVKHYDNFKVGSESFWRYCGEVGNDNVQIDDNNPFYDMFTVGGRT